MRYDLPFFDDAHRLLASALTSWCVTNLPTDEPADVDGCCRTLVTALGEAGWLRYCVPADAGGIFPRLDVRALCMIREILAYHAGIADFAFALQGLGSGAITLAGTPELQQRYLPQVAAGKWTAAFALSEPEAGSDAVEITTSAIREDIPGPKGISAFVVPADTPGLSIAERISVIAAHPLATLRFDGCHVPATNMLGAPGDGFKIAMHTLDIFRASVAAAAIGFARSCFYPSERLSLEPPKHDCDANEVLSPF